MLSLCCGSTTTSGRLVYSGTRAARLREEFGDAFTFLNEDPAEPGALYRAGLRTVEEAPIKVFASSPFPKTTG